MCTHIHTYHAYLYACMQCVYIVAAPGGSPVQGGLGLNGLSQNGYIYIYIYIIIIIIIMIIIIIIIYIYIYIYMYVLRSGKNQAKCW